MWHAAGPADSVLGHLHRYSGTARKSASFLQELRGIDKCVFLVQSVLRFKPLKPTKLTNNKRENDLTTPHSRGRAREQPKRTRYDFCRCCCSVLLLVNILTLQTDYTTCQSSCAELQSVYRTECSRFLFQP